jgi:hypothetical protein
VTSFDLCGDKLDYGDYDNNGDKEFNGVFPLNVTVDGVFVSFSTDGGNCIQIGDKYYKVGAVIVKGSAAPNVYYYGPDGTLEDSGLASPINASGSPAGLSNLTFCFIECEQVPMVIALKTQTSCGNAWTVDEGMINKVWDYYTVGNDGYNGKIYLEGDMIKPFGNINVSDSDADGLLEVTIDNSYMLDCSFEDSSWLFLGTVEQFNACVDYGDFNYKQHQYFNSPSLIIDLLF